MARSGGNGAPDGRMPDGDSQPSELWIEAGESSGTGGTGRSSGSQRGPLAGRSRWIALVAGFAVLVAVIAVQHLAGGPSPSPAAPTGAPVTPSPTHSAPPAGSSASIGESLPGDAGSSAPMQADDTPTRSAEVSATSAVVATAPVTSTVPQRPLPGAADWELIGYGPQGVMRHRPTTGSLTVTPVPTLSSNGPFSFVVTGGVAILRPLDRTLGYLVNDRGLATELSGLLADHGPVLPGPRPGELWASGENGAAARLILVDTRGRALGPQISSAKINPNAWPEPDGAGYALVTGLGGTYEARPDGLRLVTHGTVLAVGPDSFLVDECTASADCAVAIVDRATRTRTSLHGVVLPRPPGSTVGVISPDGTFAAFNEVTVDEDVHSSHLHLLDLRSGRDRALSDAMDVAQTPSMQSPFAFSPDSRWLAFATHSGQVAVVNTTSGQQTLLPPSLPQVTTLTVRALPGES